MQEFRVLKCSECQTFQVGIVKKDKKWSCKNCSHKQSVKLVYFKSHCAKECREKVQNLRQIGFEAKTLEVDKCLKAEEEAENFAGVSSTINKLPELVINKWAKFTKPSIQKIEAVSKASSHYEPKLQLSTDPSKEHRTFKVSNKWESSLPGASFKENSSTYSIYHQSKPTQAYKLVDYHKKPSVNNLRTRATFTEPPQKKPKTFDDVLDDDFFFDEDDLKALDNLK